MTTAAARPPDEPDRAAPESAANAQVPPALGPHDRRRA